MASYRCYLLDDAKRIQAVETLDCEQDVEALIRAEAILDGQKSYPFAEIWNGKRVVGEIRRP